jgi:ABC-type Na+ efflux pump permease subunit
LRSLLNQFMDGMSGVKIAVNLAVDEMDAADGALVGKVVQQYLDDSLAQANDPESELLEVRSPLSVPAGAPNGGQKDAGAEGREALLGMITPIMGGMMVFYAFYTGTASAQSILREEEERTLPRLFTTPTPQAAILSGKFLAVFMIVLVQVSVLLAAGRLIFGIHWGDFLPVAGVVACTVCAASTFGIFANSFLKSVRQGGVVFGGVLTITGMIGMVSIFAMNSPTAQELASSVSLLVPQGWAVRALLQAMQGQPLSEVLVSVLVLLAWSTIFFATGVWRFNRRYA